MLIKKILKQISDGIAAGLLITIGCCVFLACKDVKWVGAILFSVALLTICYKGYSLYTGKIGFVIENANKEYFSALLLGLLGNVIATAVVGIAVQYAIRDSIIDLHVTAFTMCTAKLTQEWWQTLIRGIMCGVLMYVAVAVYKEKKSIVGILFAIPVFILSGFEHSIADMGYFAIGGVYSAEAFGFIWLVILGNSIGALILPVLALFGREIKKNKCATKAVQSDAEQSNKELKFNENNDIDGGKVSVINPNDIKVDGTSFDCANTNDVMAGGVNTDVTKTDGAKSYGCADITCDTASEVDGE